MSGADWIVPSFCRSDHVIHALSTSKVPCGDGLLREDLRLLADGFGGTVVFVGKKIPATTRVISTWKAKKMMKASCEGYIALIMKDKQFKGVEEILVVCEFPDVFPDEIPGLPLV